MSFPRYPSYKPSGGDWSPEVPTHWGSVPLKYLVSMSSGGTPSKENRAYWDGDVPWASSKDLKVPFLEDTEDRITQLAIDEGAAWLVPANSVLVVTRGMILAHTFPVVTAVRPMAINQDLKALRPGRRLSPAYLPWLLRGASRASLARTAEAAHGTLALRLDEWTSLRLPVPPLAEQRQVTAFLDRETAKIDALVAEQERLIELLKEKRQAVISHAVTKGLNPDATMRSSGVEWLGDVPVHWTVSRVKWLATVSNGSTPNRDRRDYWDEGTLPWLNSSVVNSDPVAPPDQFITSLALAECHLPIARPPAVVVGITGQGKTRGMSSRLLYESTISQHLALLQPQPGVDSSFLRRVLEMAYPYLRRDSEEAGSTKGAITCEALGNLAVACPSLGEQNAIVGFLATAASEFDLLMAEGVLAVEVLRERRSALISAAVTGQIDVRGSVDPGVA